MSEPNFRIIATLNQTDCTGFSWPAAEDLSSWIKDPSGLVYTYEFFIPIPYVPSTGPNSRDERSWINWTDLVQMCAFGVLFRNGHDGSNNYVWLIQHRNYSDNWENFMTRDRLL